MVFSSGDLAKLLSVTTQTIMNYRKRGMPYHAITHLGYYQYNFDAIQWIYDNGYKTSKLKVLPLNYKLYIYKLQQENRALKELLLEKSYPKVANLLP